MGKDYRIAGLQGYRGQLSTLIILTAKARISAENKTPIRFAILCGFAVNHFSLNSSAKKPHEVSLRLCG
jgi:hypothetical protein